jgi:hypothetical protein
VSQDLIDIHNGGLTTATATSLPVFSAWLAKETGDSAAIIKAAYDLRNNNEFVEVRDKLREVRRSFDENEIAVANKASAKLLAEINKASEDIRIMYGIKTRQGVPVTKLIHVYNTFAALKGLPNIPAYNFKVKLPDFLYNLTQPRGFRAVYRNLTEDLSTIWSLGEARDILEKRVAIDEQARAYSPKQEFPNYKNAHSQFKSPM